MTRLAMLHPSNLLGQEVRETLDRHRDLWREMVLLTTREEEVGNLTDVRGAAAMVQAYEPQALAGVDLVFFCGPHAANRQVLEALPPAATAVLLSADATAQDGRPLVAGVNLEDAYRGEMLLSPHAAAIALCLLLHPLRGLGVQSATATVVLPASMREQDALDELFNQTRAILAFAEKKPQDVYGRQMAFNLAPAEADGQPDIGGLVHAILGGGPRVSAQLVEGGIFHSLSLSLHLHFDKDPGLEALRDALEEQPGVEFQDDDDAPGPIDAAARDELLIGRLARDPQTSSDSSAGYWIWAVMDNLSRGGALNAVAILEKVLDSPPAS